ncbi:MAG TPA: hypothetical protein VM582_07370, partial [Candidatus Thermoplasmatota archaeon]|nr:hypothetical protein [Candidatus Thermoplasmatota archaeon]
AAAPTAADALRAALRDALDARGLDAEAFFAAPAELARVDAHGVETRTTMAFDDALEALAGGLPAPGVAPPGTPHATVGDVLHVYANLAIGSALGYVVTRSAVAPSTPPVFLPPPATPLFFDVGGPLTQVKGSYAAGIHTVGTLVGSNADTRGNLPVVSSGLAGDTRIDFLGHAVVAQAQACLFGICLAAGSLLGDGAMAWDGSAPPIPTVP